MVRAEGKAMYARPKVPFMGNVMLYNRITEANKLY